MARTFLRHLSGAALLAVVVVVVLFFSGGRVGTLLFAPFERILHKYGEIPPIAFILVAFFWGGVLYLLGLLAVKLAGAIKIRPRYVWVSFVALLLFHGFVERLVLVPWKVHAPWVEKIDSPRWQPFSLSDEMVDRLPSERVDGIEKRNRQKLRLYKSFLEGRGKYGLRKRYCTVEGQPIIEWILVENGRLKVVHDATRDSWGGFPGVRVFRPQQLIAGYYEGDSFAVGIPDLRRRVLVLRYPLSDRPTSQDYGSFY